MGRYRKVDPRIWNDGKFAILSDNGKLVFFLLLTHPHMTALGAMRGSLPGLAAEINWQSEAFVKAFREASQKGMVRHDVRANFLWLPNFLKYNRPESPNVIKAWVNSYDLLPECDLKDELFQHLKAFAEGLPKAFTKAFLEAFGKNFPIQEQEQEQNESIVDSQGESDDTLLNFESLWKNYPNKDGKKEALKYFKADIKQGVPVTDIKQAQDNYLAHLKANPWKQPKTGKVWFNNWRDWLNWQEPEKPKGNVTSESDEDVYYDAAGRRLSLK